MTTQTIFPPKPEKTDDSTLNGMRERTWEKERNLILIQNTVRRLVKYFNGTITHESERSVYVGLRKGKFFGKIVRVSDHDIKSRTDSAVLPSGGANKLIDIHSYSL